MVKTPATLCAQGIPAAAPDINIALDGVVTAVVEQEDGRLIVAGNFLSVGGVERRHLARLNPDGSLDTSWRCDCEPSQVTVMKISGDALYVGGAFDEIGGVARPRLAKVSLATGQVDASWAPFTGSEPDPFPAIADMVVVETDLYAVGDLLKRGVFESDRIVVRIPVDGPGAIDPEWSPTTPYGNAERARTISFDGNHLFVGGTFTSVGGHGRTGLVKIGPDGAVDPDWNPIVESRGALDVRHVLAVESSLWVAGEFSAINAVPLDDLAKISIAGVGTVDPTVPAVTDCERLAWDGQHLYLFAQASR